MLCFSSNPAQADAVAQVNLALVRKTETGDLTRLLDVGRNEPTHSDMRENKQVQHVSSVSSAHVSLHECTSHSPTREHHLRTLHHVLRREVQILVAVSTIDRRSISRLTSDLPSATCRRTPVLLHQPRFHSQLEIQPSLSSSTDLETRVQPIIDVPAFRAAMQEIVQFNAMEHFNENVTHSKKHTFSDHDQYQIRMHHDILITRSVTMYPPFVPPEFIRMYSVFGTMETVSNCAFVNTSATSFPKHLLAIRVPQSALFKTHSLPFTRRPEVVAPP